MAFYKPPAWVEEGMIVWIRWDEAKGTALRRAVATAAGNHARVVSSKKYGVDKWMAVDQLLVPPDDKHTHDALPDLMREIFQCAG